MTCQLWGVFFGKFGWFMVPFFGAFAQKTGCSSSYAQNYAGCSPSLESQDNSQGQLQAPMLIQWVGGGGDEKPHQMSNLIFLTPPTKGKKLSDHLPTNDNNPGRAEGNGERIIAPSKWTSLKTVPTLLSPNISPRKNIIWSMEDIPREGEYHFILQAYSNLDHGNIRNSGAFVRNSCIIQIPPSAASHAGPPRRYLGANSFASCCNVREPRAAIRSAQATTRGTCAHL